MLRASAELDRNVTAHADDLVRRLRQLGRDELTVMYEAAEEATECLVELAKYGRNPVTEVVANAPMVGEWAHFPPGDVIDRATQSQYYYHAHAAAERIDEEHGHFHTFVRLESAEGHDVPIVHLVGVSTDASGRLLRLFTTNRWVTGESWRDADDVISLLDRFDITTEAPSRPLNRWISATLRMFRPQAIDVIRARDVAVAQFAAAHPNTDVYEDRTLQVTSETSIDFLDQIRAIESALDATP